MAHSPQDPVAVRFENVGFGYAGSAPEQRVLDGITLDVREGERLGILGPNGGGKSTLIKLTLGLLEPQQGSVRVLGLAPAEARRRHLVGYVAQRMEAELGFPLSARQVVELGAALGTPPWRGLNAAQRAAVDDALAVVDAARFADRPVGELSGGMLQRVLIARALAARPRLLLLDEPTVGIDPAGQQQFAQLLGTLVQRLGVTLIVVSHDLRTIVSGCDRVACLARTLHSHGAPAGLTPAILAEVFRHDVAAIFGDVHVDAHAAAACNDPHHHHATPAQRADQRASGGGGATPPGGGAS